MSGRKRVAVLISGRGSNMDALVRAAAERDYPADIVGVIANRPDARGLAAAQAARIDTVAIPHRDFSDRSSHEAAVDEALHAMGAEIVCLAGYMRILSPGFVEGWKGRMINIHPSLLPLLPGLDTHSRALAAGVRVHGCTVHFVTEIMDEGPIIAQAAVPVLPDDDPDRLAARVLKAEHELYPFALSLVARGKAVMEGDLVRLSGVEAGGILMSPAANAETSDLERLARMTP